MNFFGLKEEKKEINEEVVATNTPQEQSDSEPVAEEKSEQDLFQDALEYCTSLENNFLINIQRGTLTKEGFFKEMSRYLYSKTNDEEVVKQTLKKLETFIWGYYVLEDLINDPSISDIKVLSPDNIRIKRFGKRMGADVHFKDEADYKRFVDIICSRNKVNLSDINAIVPFTDVDSNKNFRLRFDLMGAYINSSKLPIVCIRKIPKTKKSLEELCEKDENGHCMFPKELLPYLKDKAANSPGIIFTGKGAAGKTTLMNAMIDRIPEDKSGLVIQQSDELFSTHPDMIFQNTVQASGDGKIQYGLDVLSVNGLLIDLDYFIIGEIKGKEAAEFMNAAYTGHQCWASVHGANSQEAINKLVDYIKKGTDYSVEDTLRMLRFMNCIIFMKNFQIEEISEIKGFDSEKKELIYELVYTREKGLIKSC